jgi:hypothetical protein
MTASVLKTVLVPESVKWRANDAKWKTRRSVSEQIAAIVDDIAAGAVATRRTAPEPNVPLRYTTDPARYDAAAAACAAAGLTLSDVIRDELIRRLDDLEPTP